MQFEDFASPDNIGNNSMTEHFASIQENLTDVVKATYYYLNENNKVIQSSSNVSTDTLQNIMNQIDPSVSVEDNMKYIMNYYQILFKNDVNKLTDTQIKINTCVLNNFLNTNKTELLNCFFSLIQNKLDEAQCKMPQSNDNCVSIAQANDLKNMVEQQQGNIGALTEKIQNKDEELRNKIERSTLQQREIEYKRKLIATRNRMLELSQEKNIYKTKVIYTLLAVVIAIIIAILASYVYYKK